ncbi:MULTISPECIES: hypothetical protein [unclassified Streptomyces]|uniref:hypothetical protein n=1 Tax=unclassified Streptomyces TaxID=2593676 RepID=UPI001CC1841A|nr:MULTISPECIES: hypothetical protein [unclassified Streptomyces]WPO70463.1 hypothetical protein R9806_07395 [Streptomyces sp. KN37]
MSTRRRGRRTPVTRFLNEVLDSARDLTDDALDRAGDAERDLRRGIVRLVRVDGRRRRRSDRGRDADRPARFEREGDYEKGGGRIIIEFDDDRQGRSERDLRYDRGSGDRSGRYEERDDRQVVASDEDRGLSTTGSGSGGRSTGAAGGKSGK